MLNSKLARSASPHHRLPILSSFQAPSGANNAQRHSAVNCEKLKKHLRQSRSRLSEFAEWPDNRMPEPKQYKRLELEISSPKLSAREPRPRSLQKSLSPKLRARNGSRTAARSHAHRQYYSLQEINEANLFEEDSFKEFAATCSQPMVDITTASHMVKCTPASKMQLCDSTNLAN